MDVVDQHQPGSAVLERGQFGRPSSSAGRCSSTHQTSVPAAAMSTARRRSATDLPLPRSPISARDPTRALGTEQLPDVAHQLIVERAPDVPLAEDAEPGRVVLEGVEPLGRRPALARIPAVGRHPGDPLVLARQLAHPQPGVDRQQATGKGRLWNLIWSSTPHARKRAQLSKSRWLNQRRDPLGGLGLGGARRLRSISSRATSASNCGADSCSSRRCNRLRLVGHGGRFQRAPLDAEIVVLATAPASGGVPGC